MYFKLPEHPNLTSRMYFFYPHLRICLLILGSEKWGGGVAGGGTGRGVGGERQTDRHSRMCPDQGSNSQPFGIWEDALTEPLGQGLTSDSHMWLVPTKAQIKS